MGFLVSERGIEANPKKIKAITSLAKPAALSGSYRDFETVYKSPGREGHPSVSDDEEDR